MLNIAVTVSLPPGWRLPSVDGAGELFGDPRFLDNEHFTSHYQLTRLEPITFMQTGNEAPSKYRLTCSLTAWMRVAYTLWGRHLPTRAARGCSGPLCPCPRQRHDFGDDLSRLGIVIGKGQEEASALLGMDRHETQGATRLPVYDRAAEMD